MRQPQRSARRAHGRRPGGLGVPVAGVVCVVAAACGVRPMGFSTARVLQASKSSQVVSKTAEQLDTIKQQLGKSIFFSCLGDNERLQVIEALHAVELQPGERIIKMGDRGSTMYLVASGSLDCVLPINGTETVVHTCYMGDIFGELAILYNRPRAAHVVCQDEAVVWELHESVFWGVAKKNSEQWEQLVQTIFRFFDTDGSGRIDSCEVHGTMRALGAQLSKSELEDILRTYDTDGDGEICMSEFTEMLHTLPNKHD